MNHVLVSVPEQRLLVLSQGTPLAHYPISTSKFGLGSEEGSNRTPLGLFRICEKYGSRAPLGTIFKGRRPTGRWQPGEPAGDDLVLTRILRLEGLQPGLENTYGRYIYLHGTGEEELIGQPASHGCLRLRNEDIAELYPLLPVGSTLEIFNRPL
ncbi:L,D-transpeptidase [Roseibacillus ishigakijimensis]|uniref:L,D-transpeptidase n=1 Tax=Roseibacillus ishigakijimensis TaxID=454146 RepID=A0A934RV91_9BACT|nr:L,D-transpeptidase [Roseibacillus ishigakijimensis]MBK1834795.1 L,D-transpeptidase [Roseibacillus ishigakijimensis]